MRLSLTILCSLLIITSLLAGDNIDFDKLKKKYSKHNAVILNEDYNYVIDVKGDSLSIQQSISKRILVLSEHSKGFTNDYVFENGFEKIVDIEAFTQVPKGKKYSKIKVESFKEFHDRGGSAFFDDTKTIKFSYPSIKQGAITNCEYTLQFNNPRFLRHCYLQSWLPLIESKITFKVHQDVQIGYKIFHDEDIGINYKTYTKGKYTYYEWEVNDLEPYKYMGADQYSIRYYSPHIAFYIKETNINDQNVKYFGETADLYRYYSELLSTAKNPKSEELIELVNKITIGLPDREKAKTIYYWVQNNIKYVAYEHGLNGFIPMPAADVFSKRFGDCKGMSNLIKEMMNIAGLPTYLTWVGTRSIPYKYDELPLPAVDNHMIATYIKDDSVFVMDATFKYLDFGTFPYHIQEKEILIGTGPEEFKIFEVPLSKTMDNQITDSVNISIIGDSIVGSAVSTSKGVHKMNIAHTLDGVKDKNIDKVLSRIYNKGSNKFKVKDYKITNLFERDTQAQIEYDFILHDYYTKIGNEIFINLHLDKTYQDYIVDTTGLITPIENEFYSYDKQVTRFKIPEGYALSFIPENGKFDNNEFSYTINYRQEGNYIIMEKEIKAEFLVLLEDKFDDWNKMIKSLNKHYRSSIVLNKIDENTN